MIFDAYNLSKDIDACISKYKKSNEPNIIEKITAEINSSPHRKQTTSDKNFNVEIFSEYLHGHRSQCKFIYAPENKVRQRELCDLIVVSIVAERNRIVSMRTSFVQAKKGTFASRSYKIDPLQLFLLTNFPEFEGVNGANLSGNKTVLKDDSHSLGSYLLFTPTLEFIWTTAKIVNLQMSTSKTLKASALNSYFATVTQPFGWHPYWSEEKRVIQNQNTNPFLSKTNYEIALPSTKDFFNYFINHKIGQHCDPNDNLAYLVNKIVKAASGLDEVKSLLNTSDFGLFQNVDETNDRFFTSGIGIIAAITTIGE